MTRAEKLLYHQIHPLKLATDVTSSILSCWLVWRHSLLAPALVGLLPSLAITALLVARADLDALKTSAFGLYVQRMMTPALTAERATGQIIMWWAAWKHEPIALGLGFVVIVLAWLAGLRVSSVK